MVVKNINLKRKVAQLALKYIPKGGPIGLGSGTTIDILAQMIEKPVNPIYCVSKNAKKVLKEKKATQLSSPKGIKVAFDGVDQIVISNKRLVAIKGAGALDFAKEKALDYSAKELVLLADKSKLRKKKVAKIFVEIEKKFVGFVLEKTNQLGVKLKKVRKNNPNLVGKKNVFYYFNTKKFSELSEMEDLLESIKGVVCCGIFSKKKFILLVGYNNYVKVVK